jgi:hypothetical protein
MTEDRLLSLYDDLLARAEQIALESYGCDLDRLDPSCLEYYGSKLTEDNLEDLASDLADAAWFEY